MNLPELLSLCQTKNIKILQSITLKKFYDIFQKQYQKTVAYNLEIKNLQKRHSFNQIKIF